jgi:AhpD family alkylhydroperoxidase
VRGVESNPTGLRREGEGGDEPIGAAHLIPANKELAMIAESRADVDREIESTLGLVPEFFRRVPDYLVSTEWASFKNLELSDQTAIPNKYKELIGLAVSGATRCRYCCYFHTEAARLFGANEDEITEAALIAKNTMGWSTYLNTLQFDYDAFVAEFDQIAAHVREQMTAGAPA